MKNSLVFFLITILLAFEGVAQITSKGTPVFYSGKQDKIPLIILPEINKRKLKKEDRTLAQSKLKKVKYAELIEVDIDVKTEGFCVKKENTNIYYTKIKSPGAYSLGIFFSHYRLPIGASLFVYSSDYKHIRGSFTYKNNKLNYILPIAPIKGDEIILEYHEPNDVDFPGELHISSIAHDYKNIFKYLDTSKGFGDSGDCNININCDDNELWQLLKHSVCKITYNGWLCSGALVNNSNNDAKPYLLTANHCINNPVDASSAIFYFNYESLDCLNTDGPKDQTVSSSSIVASPPLKTLDFTLLELSINPPALYKPYYAGWNRDIINPQSVTSIHHPSGDTKKITKSFDGATTNDYGEGYNEYTHWWIDAWDEGTTEGGSSGSPLFDQTGRIIGDLTGGDARCDYNFNDYYQKISNSWKDFSDSSYQLKPWLDPLNSGILTLNGYQPFDTIPTHLRARYNDTVVSLRWNDVVDTSRIESYYIYRDSVKLDSVEISSYNDTTVQKSVLYKYFITAKYQNPFIYESKPSNEVYVRIMEADTLPFSETFEGGVLPDYWYEERSNDTIGWLIKSGGLVSIIDTAFEGSFNAYFYGENGETSKLVLPKFDFSSYLNLKLSFYLHMEEFNNEVHRLRVLYKDSDTLDWKILREFNNFTLGWVKKNIPLKHLSNNYQIAFEGVGLKGSGICIDSVAINEDGKFIDPEFVVNKDSICLYDSVEFSTALDNSYNLTWDFGTDANPSIAFGPGPHKVKYSSVGIKAVQLVVNDTYFKLNNDAVIVFYEPAVPGFTNIGDTLISSSDIGNQWYLNGLPIDGANQKEYVITKDGDYYVEVTNSFKCSHISDSKYMIVSDLDELQEVNKSNSRILVYPNPNSGSFTIDFKLLQDSEEISYKLIDITGKVIQTGVLKASAENQKITLVNSKNGIYFIQLYTSGNYYSSKIVIKK